MRVRPAREIFDLSLSSSSFREESGTSDSDTSSSESDNVADLISEKIRDRNRKNTRNFGRAIEENRRSNWEVGFFP